MRVTTICRPTGALLLPALLLAACGGQDDSAAGTPAAQTAATATAGADTGAAAAAMPASATSQGGGAVQPDGGPTSNLPPNELGRFMVLEYHRIGDNEGEWVRSRANFQKDLETLYQKGYRPITMRQMAEGNIDVPAGTTPVVFTIDDSSRGQFYYRPDGSIDPNTMMGMWANFQRKNPGWHYGAVWCILPAAQHPSNFFGETPDKETPRAQREATIRKKMEYIVQNRHEACNHTLYHARLDRGTDAQVQEWLGRGEDSIKVYLPEDYKISTMALPLGMWPKNRSLAWRGNWSGRTYEYQTVLEVSGGASVSPFDSRYNARSVNRFIVAPGALERQLAAWDKDPSERFVSDGDLRTVSYPQRVADRLDRGKLGGRTARVVPDGAQAGTPAPAPAPGS
ncbi:hypothetical protein BH20GEM3_BH20GEM3_14910 [soil metagenome]